MAPARPYWKGYLKLSLVSCPIALYSATSSSERVSFRQINRRTGNRLRQQLVDDVTREPVESEDKARGYEYAKNAYIIVEDEELEAIEIESSHTIEIDSFVPRAEVDERYSTALITSRPMIRLARKPSLRFVRRCEERKWRHSRALSLRNGSTSSCSSHGTVGYWEPPCAIPTRFGT